MILDINHEACEGFQGNYFALAAVLREALLWSGGGDAAWSIRLPVFREGVK